MNFLENDFKKIFFFLILIRIPFYFIPINWGDLQVVYWNGRAIFDGLLPYRDFNNSYFFDNPAGNHIHPPIFYYLYMFAALLGRDNIVFFSYMIKSWWLSFDLIVIITIYMLSKELLNVQKAKIICIIYGFSPASIIIASYLGIEESFTMILSLFSVYFFIKKKYWVSAIFTGLGFSHAIMPLFYLIYYIPNLIKQKKWQTCIIYLLILFSVYMIISIPFLILCPKEFLYYQIYMFQRGSSITFLPTIVDSFFNQAIVTMPILNFNITIKLIGTGLIALTLFIYFLKEEVSQINVIKGIFLIHLLLPFITYSTHHRLIYWIFPYALILIMTNPKIRVNLNELEKYIKLYAVIMVISAVVLLIYHYTIWNNYYQLTIGTRWYVYFLFILIIWLVIWITINLARSYNPIICFKLVISMTILYCAFIITFFADLGQINNLFKIVGLGCLIIGSFLIYNTIANQKE